jgi:hypothetical protein
MKKLLRILAILALTASAFAQTSVPLPPDGVLPLPLGSSITFVVSAESPTPVTYQWRKNGMLIEGATDTTYVLTQSLLVSQAAIYDCIATNEGGSTKSNEAIIKILVPPPVFTIFDIIAKKPSDVQLTVPAGTRVIYK